MLLTTVWSNKGIAKLTHRYTTTYLPCLPCSLLLGSGTLVECWTGRDKWKWRQSGSVEYAGLGPTTTLPPPSADWGSTTPEVTSSIPTHTNTHTGVAKQPLMKTLMYHFNPFYYLSKSLRGELESHHKESEEHAQLSQRLHLDHRLQHTETDADMN